MSKSALAKVRTAKQQSRRNLKLVDENNRLRGELKQSKAELASLREELDALRLVADAARTGQGLDDALDALDALKGEK
jgi:hypothetical protein